jgi:hypothetical protein
MFVVVGILKISKQFGVESGMIVSNWAMEKAGIKIICVINPFAIMMGLREQSAHDIRTIMTQEYVQKSTISRIVTIVGEGTLYPCTQSRNKESYSGCIFVPFKTEC